MIKIHCNQLSDFLKIYVLDWHVLCAFLIPLLFATLFPIYWFVICPLFWKTDLSLYRPRSWLLGYWLFASVVWFVFLVICFFHLRNGRKVAMAMSNKNCMGTRSYSTEDLWNEDSYIIPEPYMPTPEFKVNLSQVQPSLSENSLNSLKTMKRPLKRYKSEIDGHLQEQKAPLLLLPPPKDYANNDAEESFDSILASLQSLASELEKDFVALPEQDADQVSP